MVQIASGSGHDVALIGRGRPHILPSPTRRAVPVGSPLNIYVRATGELPMRYEWRHNGVLLPDQPNNWLRVASLESADAGNYELTVSNAQGVTQQIYEVAVVPFTIVSQPKPKLAPIKSDYELSIDARGLNLRYQWEKDGIPIPGATAAQLILHDLSWDDAGSYRVRVSNNGGSLLSEAAQVQLTALGYVFPASAVDSFRAVPVGLSNVLRVFNQSAVTRDGAVFNWAPSESGGPVAHRVPFISKNIVDYRGAALTADGRIELTPGVFVAGLSNVISITPGGLALTPEGRVLPYQQTEYSTNIPPGLSDVVEIADGLAIHGDGTVTTWTNGSFFPGITLPAGLSNVISGSASVTGDVLLFADGQVRRWVSTIRPVSVEYPPAAHTNPVDTYSSFYGSAAVLEGDGTVSVVEGPSPEFSGVSDVSLIFFDYSIFAIGEGDPVFQRTRTNRTGEAGVPLFLKARAFGAMPIRYQWRFAGQDLAGETNIFLKVVKSTPFTGAYELIATNSEGAATKRFQVRITGTAGSIAASVQAKLLLLDFTPPDSHPHSYELLRSGDLKNWSVVATDAMVTDGIYRFQVPIDRSAKAAFFKVRNVE